MTELAQRFPNPLWEPLKGKLDWDLAVTLRNREVSQETPSLDYRLSSRLQGLSIELPSPLGKPARTARDLEVTGTLVPGHSMDIAGHLGDLGANLRLELGLAASRLTSGRLRFGDPSAPAPERPGLFLDGSLKELDPIAWMAWWETQTPAFEGEIRVRDRGWAEGWESRPGRRATAHQTSAPGRV